MPQKKFIRIGSKEYPVGLIIVISPPGKGKSVYEWSNILINNIIKDISKLKKANEISANEIRENLTIEKIENILPYDKVEIWKNLSNNFKNAVFSIIISKIEE